MKLAQVVADGRPGGGTTLVQGLIEDLERERPGDAITLVSQPQSELQRWAQGRGLDFVAFDFFAPPWDLRVSQRLAAALAGRCFDLAHFHGLRAAHHALRRPAAAAWPRRVYTVHGLHQLHLGPWVRWLGNLADRRVMAKVDATVFVACADLQAARDWRLAAAGAPVEVIHNGVDVEAIARLGLSPAQRDLDVVYVARHVEQKDPLAAARVLRALAGRGHRCAMAGDGPLLPATLELLRAGGAPEVSHLGACNRDRALDLMARARVVLMPSRWEGLPLLPLEAMALGTPVVATELPGTAEALGDGAGGVRVAPGDHAALVAAVERLLGDPAAWAAHRAAGLARVREQFSRQNCSLAYQRLYDAVLAQHGAKALP